MKLQDYYCINPEEKPLENLVEGGGFVRIFRRIAFVGDSLSAGEFESVNQQGKSKGYDLYEYSWGQYIARMCGCTGYNFSRGGMTAREYCKSFAAKNGFWDKEKACQAYVIALGVNDILNAHREIGSVQDIDLQNYANNKPTFMGHYGQIIQNIRKFSPTQSFSL